VAGLSRRHVDQSYYENEFDWYDDQHPYDVLIGLDPADCVVAPVGPLVVTVRGPGQVLDFRRADICAGKWRRAYRKGARLAFKPSGDGFTLRPLTIKPTVKRRARAVYRLTIRFRGRAITTRKFRVEWRYTPSRRIYENTDAFQNVCINETDEYGRPYAIWRKNGRYYCEVSSHSSRKVTLL
jgi:hypothetical protein